MKNIERHFNGDGISYIEILTSIIEAELERLINEDYNSDKDIVAIQKED